MKTDAALLCDLAEIVADAGRATPADDRAIERERPLFAALLNPEVPYLRSMKRKIGWPRGKPRQSRPSALPKIYRRRQELR